MSQATNITQKNTTTSTEWMTNTNTNLTITK